LELNDFRNFQSSNIGCEIANRIFEDVNCVNVCPKDSFDFTDEKLKNELKQLKDFKLTKMSNLIMRREEKQCSFLEKTKILHHNEYQFTFVS
jgi:NAD-dependent dihydropyrimidine dehydrogenase PreA subunit